MQKHTESNSTILTNRAVVFYNVENLFDTLDDPLTNDGEFTPFGEKKWDDFINAYETVFERCNKVPWNFIPSNYNWAKTYATAVLYIKTLKEMKLEYPQLDSKQFIPKYKK